MLRRSILALSHRRLSVRRVQKQISPSSCFRRDFSSVPPGPSPTNKPRPNPTNKPHPSPTNKPHPSPTNKPPGAGSNLPKVIFGSVAIGACFIAAYSGGYLDEVLGKNASLEKSPKQDGSLQYSHNVKESLTGQTGEGSHTGDIHVDDTKDLTQSQPVVDPNSDSSNLKPAEVHKHVQVDEAPNSFDSANEEADQLSNSSTVGETSKDNNVHIEKSFEDTADSSSSVQQVRHEGLEADEKLSTVNAATDLQGNSIKDDQQLELKSQIEHKDTLGQEQGQSPSLLSSYSLNNEADEGDSLSSENSIKQSSLKEETSPGASEDKADGKLILDFLQAIHAAEQRQAELDALVLAEEKRAMKDKYEKELKDARARELRYAEEAAMLEKEVKKERSKAAAALKSLQEKAEERLKMAVEEKEREAESKVKEIQDIAKAELAASIAREKAAQIEKMTEANLNIHALCMAFFARSEEARQTHSIHKLALGALALQDALSNGLPVQAELNALGVYIESVDKDSLLQLAVSSLPEDVRLHGTDSVLNLNQKFKALKGSLRHFSLIPPDGGGLVTHSLARVASFLKVNEADESGDGIESVINKVESLLAAGKLVEAADTLEDGVEGTKASAVVSNWLKMVRNRAIAEQALVLLQSYATSMSLN